MDLAKLRYTTNALSAHPGTLVSNSTPIDAGATQHPRISSEEEARGYYAGLHSRPPLVARSSSHIWERYGGIEGFEAKTLSPFGFHPIFNSIWDAKLIPALTKYLDDNQCNFTSLDPIRIGSADDPSPPRILWIGVAPGSLSPSVGLQVAITCRDILLKHGIADIHVEIRESSVILLGWQLRTPEPIEGGVTPFIVEPFSTSIGLSISTEEEPHVGGTGGFFIRDRHDPRKLYLITANHVVICSDTQRKEGFDSKAWHGDPKKVLLFSERAYAKHTNAMKRAVANLKADQDRCERACKSTDMSGCNARLEQAVKNLEVATQRYEALDTIHNNIPESLVRPEDRVVGTVALAPAITLGHKRKQFTRDWALVEVDGSTIGEANFVGNKVDLRCGIEMTKLQLSMVAAGETGTSLVIEPYHDQRFLEIRGIIPEADMPISELTEEGRMKDLPEYLPILKLGQATGLTIGRMHSICSVVRRPIPGLTGNSRDLVVLPQEDSISHFSKPGDSGSAIIDGRGRLAGLLTAGAGAEEKGIDLTYATPAFILDEDLRKNGIDPDFTPPALVSKF